MKVKSCKFEKLTSLEAIVDRNEIVKVRSRLPYFFYLNTLEILIFFSENTLVFSHSFISEFGKIKFKVA